MNLCVNRFRITNNWKWRLFGCRLALLYMEDWLLWLSINRWIWNDIVLYVLIVDRIIGRNIGSLLRTTTFFVGVAAASALFLPYHSFIDSRLPKSIIVFLVNKWNESNESIKSNNSNLEINDPSVYEWLNDNRRNQ